MSFFSRRGFLTFLAPASAIALLPVREAISSANSTTDHQERGQTGIDRLRGQTVFLFGDSISTTNYNGGWIPWFIDATGCELKNFAMNGSFASRMVDRLCIEGMARRDSSTANRQWKKPDPKQCKAVIIMLGTNDQPRLRTGGIEAIIPPGKIEQYALLPEYWNLFPDNYVGNIALIIEYIKYNNPQAEIYLASCVHRADDKNKMERVSQLCSQIAAYYSIPHIDATHNAGFSFKFIHHYLVDGVHPTKEGNAMLGKYITRAIMSA